MNISIVVAAAKNNAIGKNGKLPWHLPADMKHFKNITWGMPIIMGRKTFESLGKPLSGRKNIVISRQAGEEKPKKPWKAEGAVVVNNLDDALFVAKETDARETMVNGGGEIYRLVFDQTKRIYLTRVKAEPEGDTFFPDLDRNEWHLVSQQNHDADEKNEFAYSFEVWEKIFK
jgi:dihydrofolate reductase